MCDINKTSDCFKPEFFISGGETGGDSIPLDCCKTIGVKTTGYMPKGYKRSDGNGEKIAAEFNLIEGTGSYPWRDQANAKMSDAIIGFLTSKPMTGKGTMQTVSVFIREWYRREDKTWIPINMPVEENPYIVYSPESEDESTRSVKPALVIWDLSDSNINFYAPIVKDFLNEFKPSKLMFSGPTLQTDANITENGSNLMKKVFGY